MTDPRKSDSADVRAAVAAWDAATPYSDSVLEGAMQLRARLRDSTSHEAFAWASLTCGRMADDRVEQSEVMLAEALGRFVLIENRYGEALASACMAIPHTHRRNMDRALELVLRPFGTGIAFRNQDLIYLHNLAASCYCERNEHHSALGHLTKGYDLAVLSESNSFKTVILSNIGCILLLVGEDALAVNVLTESLKASESDPLRDRPDPNILSNLALGLCNLGKYAEALRYALRLQEQLEDTNAPGMGVCFESISDTFAFNGMIEAAELSFSRSKQVRNSRTINNHTNASSLASSAILLEAKHEFGEAIAAARKVWELTTATESPTPLRLAAKVLSRCYRALGHTADAMKWARYAEEVNREKLLAPMMLMQVRTSIVLEKPHLTDIELTCLSLSARGQSSADIALKLGIKPRTVNFHFANILRKLNALNRHEAISKAIGADLLRAG